MVYGVKKVMFTPVAVLLAAGLGDSFLDLDESLCDLGLHRFLLHLLSLLRGNHMVSLCGPAGKSALGEWPAAAVSTEP